MITVGILTVSDRSFRGEREDLSGPALRDYAQEQGWAIQAQAVVPDEIDEIKKILITWADHEKPDVILTTGGTGFAPRDVTPEATAQVIQRDAPGIAEAIRWEGLKQTPHAMLSRGLAGIRGRTLIVNLPGSPKGAVESLKSILAVIPHAVELINEGPASEKGH